jgi:co-chaperonin GroES (HSP10)
MVDAFRSKPNIDKDKPAPWRRVKKNLIPVMNQLLVQLLPEEDEYKSPIIVPEASREGRGQVAASQRFLVIAVGPKVEQVKEGNIVVQVLGVPSQFPPGVIHKGERLLILVETQCVSVECDEDGNAVVMLDD